VINNSCSQVPYKYLASSSITATTTTLLDYCEKYLYKRSVQLTAEMAAEIKLPTL